MFLLTVGCEAAKGPVEKLTFEQLETAFKSCKSTGKTATDNYCKEVAVVYEDQSVKRHEKARLAKLREGR
ncbi:hypothetical protein UNDKW_0065 [Undibacterium sp. KW1]|uniref:hypothetical protein n=1 Tax=Undibacterium sp. KW1 TaxID=2058624 RepID=UPI001331F4E5|nr:hypothetical protein [Undibacterium sp. KW1]BBB58338.1 hypothetical protein UNDKW_0065 [Undibacterium sp. KW1]